MYYNPLCFYKKHKTMSYNWWDHKNVLFMDDIIRENYYIIEFDACAYNFITPCALQSCTLCFTSYTLTLCISKKTLSTILQIIQHCNLQDHRKLIYH